MMDMDMPAGEAAGILYGIRKMALSSGQYLIPAKKFGKVLEKYDLYFLIEQNTGIVYIICPPETISWNEQQGLFYPRHGLPLNLWEQIVEEIGIRPTQTQ